MNTNTETKEASSTNNQPTSTTFTSEAGPKVGELLVKEGLVTDKDVQKALSIQKEEKKLINLPIGEIFLKTGLVTQENITEGLKHPELRKNLGALAVKKGFLRAEDLKIIEKKQKQGQYIGELLCDYGLLKQDDIGILLKEQYNSPKLGQILVNQKLITSNQLLEALKRQHSARTIGEILCDLTLITPQYLHYVLDKYNKQISMKEVLIKLGYISEQQIVQYTKGKEVSPDVLVKLLLSKKIITLEQYNRALAKKYNLPFKTLIGFAYTNKDKTILSNLIIQKYSEKNLILPLSLNDTKLTIALFKPECMNIANELQALYPHFTISFVLILQDKFEELFEILYSRKLKAFGSDGPEVEVSKEIDFIEIDLDENIEENEVNAVDFGIQDIEAEEMVNFIVKYGILSNASDIHIEQDREGAKIRYRIDGILQQPNVGWLNRRIHEMINAVISRIKVISNLDIAEKRMPQDGVFRIKYLDKPKNKTFDLDFRVASCPAIAGENITIRILDSRNANVGLDNLNHSPGIVNPFKKLLKSSAGMVLVSGPTGSGKSSTLYGALRYLYHPGLKIITAEDPIEYNFPGVMQTQINTKINLSFSRLLRSFLRLDPDVILVGEMRDNETASIGFDAAQTGHLLLSTIHTNDAISAVSRLADLNVEFSQIASCLLAVIAQRLIRRICPFCKTEYSPEEDEWKLLFNSYPSHLNFFKGPGCESCNFTGYKGRTLISELFVVDKEISLALGQGLSENMIRDLAQKNGMITMLEDGLSKVNETSLSELLRVLPFDMITAFRTGQPPQNPED